MKHVIELTLSDNNTVQTAINGTEQEIYNYYQEGNRMAWAYSNKEEQVPQVKRIKFVESKLLKTCSSVGIVYLFVDYDENGLLQ